VSPGTNSLKLQIDGARGDIAAPAARSLIDPAIEAACATILAGASRPSGRQAVGRRTGNAPTRDLLSYWG